MHTPFPIFTIFLIFVVTTFVYRANLEKKRLKRDADFWAREDAAKNTPKKDLSEVAFIHVPIETFPIGVLDSDEAAMTEEELLEQGIKPNTIRLSIGTENVKDLKAALEAAFEAVK
mgnify:CR=1 FL=1